jgi:hypothetical protein
LVESSPHPHAVFIILISSFFLQCPQNIIFLGIEDTKWISEEIDFEGVNWIQLTEDKIW